MYPPISHVYLDISRPFKGSLYPQGELAQTAQAAQAAQAEQIRRNREAKEPPGDGSYMKWFNDMGLSENVGLIFPMK